MSSVRMAKCMWKKFEKVNEVLNTSPKARIWRFLKTATHFFALLATVPLFHTRGSHRRLHGTVAALWLSVFISIFAPVFLTTRSHHNFNCIPKEGQKLGPHPTENTLCKISSLTLRRSAIMEDRWWNTGYIHVSWMNLCTIGNIHVLLQGASSNSGEMCHVL